MTTNSDNPIAGFQLIHYGDGTISLTCRGKIQGNPSGASGKGCQYFQKLRRNMHLETIIQMAYDHRKECEFVLQDARSLQRLSVRITDWSLHDSLMGLYNYWVAQGPPPLGLSISRWWDKRLVMLRWTLENREIPEGDPRYNLVRDLIEGDGPAQDRAARELGP